MKRHNQLWPRITSLENLDRAARAVLKGKRSKAHAGRFFQDWETNLLSLQRELLSGRYEPGTYRSFWIQDPKPRLISAAPFRDRVVHHALIQVIEPLFEPRFIHDSYACRTGKGQHRALARFTAWARATRYVLKLDVARFFPSLDHEILKAILRRALKDPDVLALCDRIIDGSNEQEHVVHWFPGDDLLSPAARRKGLPIGNLTSQFFANVFLDQLDHHVKERLRVKRYLRYVDDMCICGDDKAALTDLRAEILDFLLGLRLRLNERKSRIRRLKEGIEFLGFVVLPDRIRLNARAVRRQRARMKWIGREMAAGQITPQDAAASFEPWCAHAAHGDTWRLVGDVLSGWVVEETATGG
jgi:retron-type reverse transcriptase